MKEYMLSHDESLSRTSTGWQNVARRFRLEND
jgi:hypothetical protein